MLDVNLKYTGKTNCSYCHLSQVLSIKNTVNAFGISSTKIVMSVHMYNDIMSMMDEHYPINPFWHTAAYSGKKATWTVTLRPHVTYNVARVYLTGSEEIFTD